jgi:hypothetical protein
MIRMKVSTIQSFPKYFAKIRQRTSGLLPAFRTTKFSGVQHRTSLRLAILPDTLPQSKENEVHQLREQLEH